MEPSDVPETPSTPPPAASHHAPPEDAMSLTSTTSSPSDHECPISTRIKEVVRTRKLWLHKPPYHPDSPESEVKLQELAGELADAAGGDAAVTLTVLREVQARALQRIAERRAEAARLASTISVTGTLHLVGSSPAGASPPAAATTVPIAAAFSVETRGKDVRTEIEATALASLGPADQGNTELTVQIIAAGRLLRDDPTLGEQGWAPDVHRQGQPLRLTLLAKHTRLAPSLSASPGAAASPVARIRNAAVRLAQEGFADFDLSDAKTGRAVEVPPAARASLIAAIALHTKGRGLLATAADGGGAVASEVAAAALPFLTEADAAFEECRTGGGGALVDQIDNYGHLQLDIAWAYAVLGDVENLPDARQRLASAERSLVSKFERNFLALAEVAADQGKTLPPEVVQIARFWLLRGVAAHIAGDPTAAEVDFKRAALFFRGLQVDRDAVQSLIEMGATQRQAVAALRKAGGSLETAAHRLLDEEAEARERIRKREAQLRYGTTRNGSLVDPDAVATLCQMGFPKKAVLRAIKHTDNDTERALIELTTPPPTKVHRVEATSTLSGVDEVALGKMLSMGFAEGPAASALQATQNDVDAAVALASLGPTLPEMGIASNGKSNSHSTACAEGAESAHPLGNADFLDGVDGVDGLGDSDEEYEGDLGPSDMDAVDSAEALAEAERLRAEEEAYHEARDIIEEQLGQALRRVDLGDELGGALLDEELLLLTKYAGESLKI
eukprot:m.462969 g.462969  ORF g.462969 m.462969 type:complete len:732 (-) comp22853_c0_seq1:295-2490(-)